MAAMLRQAFTTPCGAASPQISGRRTTVRKAAIALTAFLGGLLIVLGLGAGSASAQEGGEAVQGTLVSAGQPVAGVKIDVKVEGGVAVGNAVSDDKGKWRVDVPSGGRYRSHSTPRRRSEGVGLINPDQQTLRRPGFQATCARCSSDRSQGERHRRRASPSESRPAAHLRRYQLRPDHRLGRSGGCRDLRHDRLTNFAHGELVTSARSALPLLQRHRG